VSLFIVLAILFAVFWLLVIRPQQRRQRVQNQMIESIEVGDEIVTAGGLYGEVRALREDELLVEIAPGTTVRIARRAVAGIIEPEEEEEDDETELESGDEAEDEEELGPAAEATEETPR
jgi:preprotein translocase subunit YajC